MISYRALWYVFTKGKKVVGKTDTNFSVGAGTPHQATARCGEA